MGKNSSFQIARSARKIQLTMGWVKTHRPDVWDAIVAVLDKEFPRKRAVRPEPVLPESLGKLK